MDYHCRVSFFEKILNESQNASTKEGGGGVSTEIFSHTKKESIEAVSLLSVS